MSGFSLLQQAAATAAFVGLVGPSSAIAEDADTEALEPASAWHLDGSEERCRLARQFGEGEDRHILVVDQAQPSDSVNLTIAGPSMKKIAWRKRVDLIFGELEALTLDAFQEGSLEGYGPALFVHALSLSSPEPDEQEEDAESKLDSRYVPLGLPSLDSDRFKGVETLSLKQGKKIRSFLQMPDFEAALKALNQCSESFVTHWGLDLEAQKARRSGPVMTNLEAVSRRILKTYTDAALFSGEQGLIRFRVMVDAQGAVTDCKQFAATVVEDLQPKICEALTHAKFDPAIGADGEPIASYYSSKVRYTIP